MNYVFIIFLFQIFVAIEGPVEEEKQSLMYSVSVLERRNFTNFVLLPRRNHNLLNSLEFERDLGMVSKNQFCYRIMLHYFKRFD